MAIRKSSISGTPFGETADRPANPSLGQTFYNATLGRLEMYTDNGWSALSFPQAPSVSATATTGISYGSSPTA